MASIKISDITQIAPAKPPFDAAVIEGAIVELARAMHALKNTRLKTETVVLLLHDMTGIGKRQITQVLNGLHNLELYALKPTRADFERVVREVAKK